MNTMDLKPRWRDLFSFETLYIFFVFAGTYKSYDKLEAINAHYDITLATTVICIVVGTFMCMCGKFWHVRRNLSYFLLYLTFVTLAVISYLAGGIYSENANLKVQKLLVFNTCALALPLFVINSRVRIERTVRLFFIVAVLMGVESVVRTQTSGFSRFVGSFGTDGYQALGVTSGMGVEIALIALLFEKKLHLRYVYGMIASVLMIAMTLAGARQALAGLIVSVLFVVYSHSKTEAIVKDSFRNLVGVGLLIVAFFVVRTTVMTAVDTSWGAARLFAVFGEKGNDVLVDSYRPMLWSAGIDVWKQYPLFGPGFGSFSEVSSFPEARQPHNMFIELMCEMGLVGLIVGGAVWWVPCRQIASRSQTATDPIMLVLGAVWLHLATCAQFSGDVTDNRQMFTFAGLILSLAASRSAVPVHTPPQMSTAASQGTLAGSLEHL